MKKTNSSTKTDTTTSTTKKSLFGLSGAQLKLVVGGSGVIQGDK
jgi:hypothetical protein